MNALLEKAQQGILQKVAPNLQSAVQRTVAAGKKVLYSDSTRHLLMQELQQGTAPQQIGDGVSKLMGVLFRESKATMPMEVASPAAALLLFEVLAFLEEAGVQISAAYIDEATKALGSSILQLFGVSPDRLQKILAAAGGGQPQPPGGIVAGGQQPMQVGVHTSAPTQGGIVASAQGGV